MIQTFLDEVPSKKTTKAECYRHVLKRSDLSVVIVDSVGHVSLISSNARAALNESGGKARLDYTEKDSDWLAELARGAGQFVHSVYQAHITAKPDKSKVQIKNSQDNTVFTLKCDHSLSKHVTDVPQWETKVQKESVDVAPLSKGKKGKKNATNEGGPAQPKMIGDFEFENVGGYQDAHKKYYQYPRLFVINNDGSARELLSTP